VYEHAHESPALMTVPLILLAICSVAVAWGWPVWDAEASLLEANIHHAEHPAVVADFGRAPQVETAGAVAIAVIDQKERYWAGTYHHVAGDLALGVVALGILF